MHRAPRRKARRSKGLGSWTAKLSVTAQQFRDARIGAGLTREQAAKLVGVSLRTVGHWESGRARPAYAGFKLLRVLKNGDLIDPAWSAYSIIRGKLVTPENHAFSPADMAWLSLTVRRSHAFGELARARHSERSAPGLAARSRPAAPVAQVHVSQPAPAVQGMDWGGSSCFGSGHLAWSLGPVNVSRGLPSSNRGVSETEQDACEAVKSPPRRAATLPKAGVAAPLRMGVTP